MPLTLLALPDDADVAVIEMGTNQPGEIALLRAIVAPDIAVVTSVQEEHLEGFGDLAGVLREESSLLDGVALAVVPASESALIGEARRRARRVVTAGLGAGDVAATAHGLHADGTGWLELDGVRVRVPLRGVHNLRNAMLALAAARELGVSLADAATGIARMPQPPMRSAVGPLGAALLHQRRLQRQPRIDARRDRAAGRGGRRPPAGGGARHHARAGRTRRSCTATSRAPRSSGADLVAGIGEFAPALEEVGAGDPRIVLGRDVDDLWPVLQPRLRADAAILLKASRGVRLERLLPYLTAWATPTA